MTGKRKELSGFLVVTGFALCFYLLTTVSGYVGGDHGIFALVAAEHGYGHAPGYPLYSIILSAFSWLPGENWFEISSRITAGLGALAAGTTFLATRAWGASRPAAYVAAWFFAFAPHVWHIHTQAEVFALNHLIVAGILCISGPDGPRPTARWTALLGLLFGFGASHHHTAVFLVPVGAVALYKAVKAVGPRAFFAFFAGLIVGLTPMSWLIWVASYHPERWHWGDPTTIDGFFNLLLRRDYGTLALTVSADDYGPLDQVRFLGKSMLEDYTIVGATAVVFGLFLAPFRTERAKTIALYVTLALTGPLFVSMLGRAPEGPNYLLVRKFHLLFELIAIIPLSLGATRALSWLRPRWRFFAPGVTLMLLAMVRLPSQAVEDPAVDVYCSDLWQSVGRDAVVIGPGDHTAMCSEYLLRTDRSVHGSFVAPHLLVHDWYRQRIEEETGVEAQVEGINVEIIGFIRDLQRKGYRVYLNENFHADILRTFPSYPRGLTIALLAEGERPPPPLEVASENAVIYEDFELEPRTGIDPDRDAWRWLVQSRYAMTWDSLANALENAGLAEPATRARNMRDSYLPSNE